MLKVSAINATEALDSAEDINVLSLPESNRLQATCCTQAYLLSLGLPSALETKVDLRQAGPAVQRYYFDENDVLDGIGVELSGPAEARLEARRMMAAAIKDTDVEPGMFKTWNCTLRDVNRIRIARIVIATLVEGADEPQNTNRTFHPTDFEPP